MNEEQCANSAKNASESGEKAVQEIRALANIESVVALPTSKNCGAHFSLWEISCFTSHFTIKYCLGHNNKSPGSLQMAGWLKTATLEPTQAGWLQSGLRHQLSLWQNGPTSQPNSPTDPEPRGIGHFSPDPSRVEWQWKTLVMVIWASLRQRNAYELVVYSLFFGPHSLPLCSLWGSSLFFISRGMIYERPIVWELM